MIEIRLPRLVGSRTSAVALAIEAADANPELAGQPVAVVGRDLRTGTESFADEMIRCLILESGVSEIVLVGVPAQFEDFVRAAAARHGVADRVRVGTHHELR